MSSLPAVESRSRRQRSAAAPPANGSRRFPPDLTAADRLRFFRAFLRKPTAVGALVPSSPALAHAMVQHCDLAAARTVVELGPGTGAFTGLILDRIGPQTLFLALELDHGNAGALRQHYPHAHVYQGTAEHLPRYLDRHGRQRADCVISGLPWGNMLPDLQDRILKAVLTSMAPDGVFTAFAYIHALWLPTSLRFRRRLERHFARVEKSRVIWRNVPPAFVYRCAQPA